jgi:hypothetical protein
VRVRVREVHWKSFHPDLALGINVKILRHIKTEIKIKKGEKKGKRVVIP